MIMHWLTAVLGTLGGTPLLLFAAVFLLTFLLEDAVAVAAGLLAGRTLIDPGVALAALVLGTIAGDMALHVAGRWLSDTAFVARLRARGMERLEAKIRKHGLLVVAGARFVPGTRLPIFVASGLLKVPTGPTGLVIAATTLLWTPSLFFASFSAGEHVLGMINPATLTFALLLVMAVAAAPRLLSGRGRTEAVVPA